MIAGRDPEHPQPVERDADDDSLPGHAGPDRDEARRVDQEKRDHLRIDDIVVIMMILVPMCRRYRRTHSELVMT